MPHKKKLTKSSLAVSVQLIERRIYLIREQKVMNDEDLAELYKVPIKRLNEQVRRNKKRFPPDFMFQLKREEAEALRSQFATSKTGRGPNAQLDPRQRNARSACQHKAWGGVPIYRDGTPGLTMIKMRAREAGDRNHCPVSIANCFVNDQIDNRQLMIAVARFAGS